MRLCLALCNLLLIVSCMTPTPFQPKNETDLGYWTQKIEDKRWWVSFAGNALTERETVENYVLFRAAQLTQAQGFSHFQIVERHVENDITYHGNKQYHATPYFSGYGPISQRYCHNFYTPFIVAHNYCARGSQYIHIRESEKFEASIEIFMYNSAQENNVQFYNAAQVYKNLAQRIIYPEQ